MLRALLAATLVVAFSAGTSFGQQPVRNASTIQPDTKLEGRFIKLQDNELVTVTPGWNKQVFRPGETPEPMLHVQRLKQSQVNVTKLTGKRYSWAELTNVLATWQPAIMDHGGNVMPFLSLVKSDALVVQVRGRDPIQVETHPFTPPLELGSLVIPPRGGVGENSPPPEPVLDNN